MDLSDYRNQIDQIDDELVRLFATRMQISSHIAEYKKEHSLPVYDPARERDILQQIGKKAGPEMENYTRVLYSMLFELSRSYQNKQNTSSAPLYSRIKDAIEATPNLFPQSAVVACQGAEGAHVQTACEKIFKAPMILYFKSSDAVFQAVEQGLCQYAVLPMENSSAGSVKKVYDLLIRHKFSIVRTFRMRVDHNLLANPGATLEDITEIYSHQHAINQCGDFLKTLPNIKIIPVENTAVAAGIVAASGKKNVAALSSNSCRALYGLINLAECVQDKENHRTTFICISKNLEIYPGADKTSIMMVLPHKPGALYKVLARMYILGINVLKLESRSLPNRDLAAVFYFDLETSIYSAEFIQLMCELDDFCEEFQYFGSYCEVV